MFKLTASPSGILFLYLNCVYILFLLLRFEQIQYKMLKISVACQSSAFVSKILNDIPILIGHIFMNISLIQYYFDIVICVNFDILPSTRQKAFL